MVTVATPDIAAHLHNYGHGRRITSEYDESVFHWINPDMIQSDRSAAYAARQLARDKYNRRTNRRQENHSEDRGHTSPRQSHTSDRNSPAVNQHSRRASERENQVWINDTVQTPLGTFRQPQGNRRSSFLL